MIKVVLITNIPAHYRVALISRSSKILKQNNIQLITIFNRLTYSRRKYWNIDERNFDFDYEVLNKSAGFTVGNKLFELGTGIIKKLNNIKPDVVVTAGFSIQSLVVTRFCILRKIPYLIYLGETIFTAKIISFYFLKLLIRKFMIKHASGFLAYGSKAKEYIKSFGINDEKINIVINTIDTDGFRNSLNNISCENKLSDSKINLLYVGDLIKRKGVDLLLKACSNVGNDLKEKFTLTIVGSGKEKNNLINLAKSLNQDNIIFMGKSDFKSIPEYYHDCDVFILPSLNEPFGLVLVEAAIAGKPLLASLYAGAAYDMVEEGKNGFILDPYDIKNFAENISTLLRSKKMRDNFGKHSLKVIEERVNIDIASKSFSNAIIRQFDA